MRYPLHSLIRMPLWQHLFFFASLFLIVQRGQAQGNIYTESFPNSFNTGFTTPIPSSSYTGSSGTWTFSSNDRATVVCNNAFFQSSPYAMKLVNYNTSGYPTSTSKSVSPNYNMSAWGCSNNVNVNFKLYTYTLSASNSCYSLYVDFSSDGGTNWAIVWQKTAAQIISTYGSGTWNTITVAMPLAYRTANFKVRFRGVQNASCNYNSYVFIDDVKMYAEACTVSTGSIGDRVWLDADGDGIQDATETGGITGVTVQLKNSAGTVIATTTTNASGNYSFTGLAAGNYKVVFPVSISGAIVTGQNAGGDDNVDSDPSQTTGETGTITLATGQNITNVDAGYCPITLALGNRVWNDANNNGINEATENGMQGVTVKLYKDDNNDNVADGAAIANTTTNATGYYLFSNLAAGNYLVGTVMPAGYMSSGINSGDPDNNIDADDNGVNYVGNNEIRGLSITLSGGSEPTNNGNENLTYDFGLYLFNVVNNCVSTATTSGGTMVEFLGVTYSGTSPNITTKYTYKVTSGCSPNVSHFDFGNLTCMSCFDDAGDFAAVTGSPYSIGVQNHTGLCGIKYDFSVDCNTSTTVSFTLKGYYGVGTIQFGLKAGQNIEYANICGPVCTPPATGSIGDRVWLDADGDGIQDATETGGITGVTVQLKNSAGTVIATTTTNASGNYSFTGLAAGNYTVVFPASISGAIVTAQNVGSDDNIDSDPSQTTGATGTIALATGQNITNVDAGYCPTTLALGNKVWYDTNNNGLESTENGIANITVKLYKDDNNDNVADGASIATTTTNSSGNYLFSNLGPGNYIVGVIIPNGYMSSSVNGGDPDNNIDLDDNGQVLSGNEIRGLSVTLVAGTEPNGNTNNTYDFGLLPDCSCTTSASNLLVNGSFESGTTGWNWSNGTLTTGTGYIACGLKNGFNSWSSGTSKVWQDVAIAAGSIVTFKGFAGTHTAGLTCSPKLSLIFLNASNIVIGQSDVTVTKNVTTNFGQLDQYSITATAPAGTTKARVQSSITCNTMKIDAFCLTATTPPASVSDFVWEDLNADGIQDAGEPGIPDVTVVLKDNIGNTIGTTTTNASGAYSFTNLVPGTYSVTFTTPSGFIASPSNAGSDDTKDSDPVAGVVSGIVLTAGLNNTTIDAGFIRLINLSGNVWHDVNAMSDGLVNSTSPVLIPPGLRAYLVNASTGLIEQIAFVNTTTGTFSFSNVNVNSVYNVVLSSSNQIVGNPPPAATLPSGWIHTGQKDANPPNSPAGSDGLNDGKLVVPVGTSDVININFGIKIQGGDVVLG